MAYPIQSLPGGGVRYSDGSVRYPAMQSVQPNMSTPYGPARQTSQGLMVTQPGGITQRVVAPTQSSSSGSLTADILRSKFGFNDPNVINSILNNPAERSRYEAEINKPGGANQSLAPLTKPTTTTAPISKPTTNFSDQVNTTRATNTSFADKLAEVAKSTLTQSNPMLNMLDKFGQLNPGSTLRQGAGDFLDAISKFGWEQLNAGRPWEDTGLSELIAGGRTKNTALASTGTPQNLLSGSESNVVRQSTQPDKNMSTNDKLKGDILGLDTQIKGGINDFRANTTLQDNAGNGDAWALVDETYNQVNDLYMQGAISEEEAQKRIRDAEMAALDQQYNKLVSNYDMLIPEYNTEADRAIEDITGNVTKAKELGTEQSTSVENNYASALRKAVKNAQQLTNQRRNMFSNLNTAESSAFLDSQTLADTELGRDLNLTEREKAAKLATIGKTVGDYETDANKEIARIKQDRDSKILKVNESKRLSESDKEVERGKILADFENALVDIQNNLNTNKVSQISNKQNFADQLALIMAQGKVDEGLINTQSNLEKQAYGLAQQMPFELDNELKGFLKAPYSSPTKAKLLKDKYPQWAELIDGVLGGQVNLQDYVSMTSGASNILG